MSRNKGSKGGGGSSSRKIKSAASRAAGLRASKRDSSEPNSRSVVGNSRTSKGVVSSKSSRGATGKLKDISRLGRRVVGIHACSEVIKVRPGAVHSVYLKKPYGSHKGLEYFYDWAKANDVPCFEENDAFFKSFMQVHQGVCLAVSEKPQFDFAQIVAKEKALVLALDGIEDPHNLGAMIRTSWLMGVDGILLPENRATSLTSTSMKVACGGAEHVPLSEETNLASSIKAFKAKGFWVYGLSHKAEQSVWDVEFNEKSVLVVGAEDNGMRLPVERECDMLISLPQVDASASYNASVATAMVVSEYFRQFSKQSKD
ncbi:MAG: 23S rRNA (guanosine(2251)-2'-O)-methyltransferase RlmB [Bdellovibrionaceae bacterium]|jgi:23S rRNA (guanosine2251-2'-O)-methyltransferase|nr:23S rRNA (guanosine(2251)-2'-O)-methyltransferase RlmB [Pseudobdellovibrionaceae bacterium]